MPEILQR